MFENYTTWLQTAAITYSKNHICDFFEIVKCFEKSHLFLRHAHKHITSAVGFATNNTIQTHHIVHTRMLVLTFRTSKLNRFNFELICLFLKKSKFENYYDWDDDGKNFKLIVLIRSKVVILNNAFRISKCLTKLLLM